MTDDGIEEGETARSGDHRARIGRIAWRGALAHRSNVLRACLYHGNGHAVPGGWRCELVRSIRLRIGLGRVCRRLGQLPRRLHDSVQLLPNLTGWPITPGRQQCWGSPKRLLCAWG